MKLTLKNFRCYINQTFVFEDDTITLIHGPSGHGKTTILLAIQFALYGSSNHKYLVSHNKVSCEVTLEYKNFTVKRIKRPNILTVKFNDTLFEDKEAQIILNKYFGVTNSSVFFMDLSTEQKMEFLGKIVNEDCDLKDLKMKIKNEISDITKNLAILDGQISNTKSMLEIIQEPTIVEKPHFEGESEALSEEEFVLKRKQTVKKLEKEKIVQQKHNDFTVEMNVIQDEINSFDEWSNPSQRIEAFTKKLKELKVKNNQLNKNREDFLIMEESVKELEKFEDVEECDLLQINREIRKLDEEIEICEKFKDLQTLKKLEIELMEGCNQEMLEHSQNVERVQNEMNSLMGEGLATSLKDLKKLEQTRSQYEVAQTFTSSNCQIDEIMEQIDALKLKFFKRINCGRCNHSFFINMDTFEKVESCVLTSNSDENNGPTTALKNKLRQLEILKDKLTHNLEFMETVQIDKVVDEINRIKKVNKLVEELKKLGSFQPSNYLKKIETKISNLRSILPSDCVSAPQRQDANILKDKRRDLTIQSNALSQRLMVKNSLLKKIEKRQDYDHAEHTRVMEEIETCAQALNEQKIELEKFKNKERLEGRLTALKKNKDNLNYDDQAIPQLEQLLKEIDNGLTYHVQLSEYKNFQKERRKYEKVRETFDNFISSKKVVEQTYLKTLLFKQMVIEAEQESLQWIIDTINSHLTILLQDFFSESFGDPIQVYLELESDKRPQVNTIINYKGNKVDYKSLSTGEYARLKLAFDLTFKEILGENIIMLDECTANLDQDLSTKIFNKIKATFPSKTILVVAHQVIMGTFEHILHL